MSDVTRILERAEQGDPAAAGDLLPLVYDELRRLAAHKMANEAAGHTLQPTALVHEAWLRLVGGEPQHWNGRSHFFAAAAEAMRRILIDNARRRQAARHGGGAARTDLEGVDLAAPQSDERLLAVHEALEQFERVDRRAAELVKLRCFVGLNMSEAAEALNLPLRSAERLWAYARAWLRREMDAPR
ncbi:MAG: sigma-70 family RNA polymerase sigma factor [Verrucomicrobia bacterium]|nr:sigma-70 family RNA polymerase sigma factor [Verrucomicrobiota bacterium]